MEAWEREHLLQNLDKLADSIVCDVVLLVKLAKHNVLTEHDVDILNRYPPNNSKLRAEHLFRILLKRNKGFETLISVLRESGQGLILDTILNDSTTSLPPSLPPGNTPKSDPNSITSETLWTDLDSQLQAQILSRDLKFLGSYKPIHQICRNFTADKLNSICTKTLTGDIIKSLLQDALDLAINSNLPPPTPNYVTRSFLRRRCLKSDAFWGDCDDVFVIKSLDLDTLAAIVKWHPVGIFGKVSDPTVRFLVAEDDPQFSKVPPDKPGVSTHFLEYLGGNFHWITSKGSLTNIQPYFSPSPQLINERELIDKSSPEPELITGPTGSGKCALLSSLGRQLIRKNEATMIIYTTLTFLLEELQNTAVDARRVYRVISKLVSSGSAFASEIVVHFLDNPGIPTILIIYWQPILDQDLRLKGLAILKCLVEAPHKNKLYLGAPPEMQQQLEGILNVPATQLQNLSEDNLENLFLKYCESKGLSKSDATSKYVKDVLSSKNFKSFRIGSTSKCLLTAEAHLSFLRDNVTPVKLSVFDMVHKILSGLSTSTFHQKSALKQLLPQCFMTPPDALKKDENKLAGASGDKDEVPFRCSTFVEYFAARFVLDKCDSSQDKLVLQTLLKTRNCEEPSQLDMTPKVPSARFEYPQVTYFINGLLSLKGPQRSTFTFLHESDSFPSVLTAAVAQGLDHFTKALLFCDSESIRASPYPVLILATIHSNLETFRALLDKWKDVTVLPDSQILRSPKFDLTPFHTAVYRGNFDMFELMAKKWLIDGRCLLHVCVSNSNDNSAEVVANKVKIIKSLLDAKNVDLEEVEVTSGGTALLQDNLHFDLLRLLIDSGANVNARTAAGESILHKTLKNKRLSVTHFETLVSDLKARKFAHFTTPDSTGRLPLFMALESYQSLEISTVTTLSEGVTSDFLLFQSLRWRQTIYFQKHVNQSHTSLRNSEGHTLLHLAAAEGDLKNVEHLLNLGADPNAQDNLGNSPLHLALGMNRSDTTSNLLITSSNLNLTNKAGDTALFHGLKSGGLPLKVIHLMESSLKLTKGMAAKALHCFLSNPKIPSWKWNKEFVATAEYFLEKQRVSKGNSKVPRPMSLEGVKNNLTKIQQIIKQVPDQRLSSDHLTLEADLYMSIMMSYASAKQFEAFTLLRLCLQGDATGPVVDFLVSTTPILILSSLHVPTTVAKIEAALGTSISWQDLEHLEEAPALYHDCIFLQLFEVSEAVFETMLTQTKKAKLVCITPEKSDKIRASVGKSTKVRICVDELSWAELEAHLGSISADVAKLQRSQSAEVFLHGLASNRKKLNQFSKAFWNSLSTPNLKQKSGLFLAPRTKVAVADLYNLEREVVHQISIDLGEDTPQDYGVLQDPSSFQAWSGHSEDFEYVSCSKRSTIQTFRVAKTLLRNHLEIHMERRVELEAFLASNKKLNLISLQDNPKISLTSQIFSGIKASHPTHLTFHLSLTKVTAAKLDDKHLTRPTLITTLTDLLTQKRKRIRNAIESLLIDSKIHKVFLFTYLNNKARPDLQKTLTFLASQDDMTVWLIVDDNRHHGTHEVTPWTHDMKIELILQVWQKSGFFAGEKSPEEIRHLASDILIRYATEKISETLLRNPSYFCFTLAKFIEHFGASNDPFEAVDCFLHRPFDDKHFFLKILSEPCLIEAMVYLSISLLFPEWLETLSFSSPSPESLNKLSAQGFLIIDNQEVIITTDVASHFVALLLVDEEVSIKFEERQNFLGFIFQTECTRKNSPRFVFRREITFVNYLLDKCDRYRNGHFVTQIKSLPVSMRLQVARAAATEKLGRLVNEIVGTLEAVQVIDKVLHWAHLIGTVKEVKVLCNIVKEIKGPNDKDRASISNSFWQALYTFQSRKGAKADPDSGNDISLEVVKLGVDIGVDLEWKNGGFIILELVPRIMPSPKHFHSFVAHLETKGQHAISGGFLHVAVSCFEVLDETFDLLKHRLGVTATDFCTKDSKGRTLTLSAIKGQRRLSSGFIDKLSHLGSNLMETDKLGNNALHLAAASMSSSPLIEHLVQCGVNINARNRAKLTPVQVAVTKLRNSRSREGQEDVLRVVQDLTRLGAKLDVVTKGLPFLHLAQKFFNPQPYHRLISFLAESKMSAVLRAVDKENSTLFHHAAKINFKMEKATMTLLQENGVNVSATDKDGRSPMDYAIRKGRRDKLIRSLLECGAIYSSEYGTLMHSAAVFENPHAVRPLSSAGCDPNRKNIGENTPLHLIFSGDIPKVKTKLPLVRALVSCGADINARDRYGRNALHGAVSSNQIEDRMDIIKFFLKHCDSHLDAVDLEENNLLHLAPSVMTPKEYHQLLGLLFFIKPTKISASEALKQRAQLVKRLLESRGGEDNLYTALHEAVTHLRLEEATLKLLRKIGVDFNLSAQGNPLLFYVIQAHRDNCGEYLQSLCAPGGMSMKAVGRNQNSALHCAAWYNNLEAVLFLLRSGADVNTRNGVGETPLHDAIQGHSRKSKRAVVKALLDHGADLGIKMRNGKTAVDLAVQRDATWKVDRDTVELLLRTWKEHKK